MKLNLWVRALQFLEIRLGGRALALLTAVLFSLAGCSSAPTGSTGQLPTTSMKIGARTYTVEIAGDYASQEHGLMERDALPADHGMVFAYAKPFEMSFWMHHTRFPLDIIFADDHSRIVSISTMQAYDEHSTMSNGLSKYAIELAAGQATAAGVKSGDQLQFPPAVDAAIKN